MIKFIRLYNTIKYLKFTQINFRIFYLFRSKIRKFQKFQYPIYEDIKAYDLNLSPSINYENLYENSSFTFLNITKKFDNIDWNYPKNGKLWVYNLTYFDFLNQQDMDKEKGLKLIEDFIEKNRILKDALEPFPISLRGINWIKFIVKNKIKDKKTNSILFSHYNILFDNLEYHLLGNHLLENGFSLLFGAYYYQNEKFYNKAKEILISQLDEQVLDDGAHFELSPMYHQIMLFRVLDCINLLKNNDYKDKELLRFLEEKASLMLAWLDQITFENGSIPLFNDSANKIAPTTYELLEYAKELDISYSEIKLKQSGYRKIKRQNYECVVDIGNIGPSYIPGHAHADTFNFELYIGTKPFIVDTGISTYEANKIRSFERSTLAHNTVVINSKNQSDVWGSFRVANRAQIIQITEDNNFIEASHNGYNKLGITHKRKWTFEENKIIIEDKLTKDSEAMFLLHFPPQVSKEDILQRIKCDSEIKFSKYEYSCGFNKREKSNMISIDFKKDLKVEIKI